jgi:hypothetical protein
MAGRPCRHQAPEEPRRSPRRRHQALEPEGHVAVPAPAHPQPDLGGRRPRVCRAPARLLAEGQPQDVPGAMRAMLSELARTRAPDGDRVARARGAEDEACWRRGSRNWACERADPGRGLRREARPGVAQPARRVGAAGRRRRPGGLLAATTTCSPRSARCACSRSSCHEQQERLMPPCWSRRTCPKRARASPSRQPDVFRVRRDANKPEIKAAVELMFEVKVDAVQVVNVAGQGPSASAGASGAARTGRRPT